MPAVGRPWPSDDDDGDGDGDGDDGDETTSPIRGHLFFPEQPTPSRELALIKLIQFPTK